VSEVDLNADLGEGFGIWRLGDDDALLDLVTSANVACGFHAGDPTIMRRVCAAAASRRVAIGAQVSYQDLAGFGRRAIDVEPARLTDEIVYQIAALDGFARLAGSAVTYVKPHGALYNRIVDDEVQAAAVVAAIRDIDARLPVLGLPGSTFLRIAAATGLPVIHEGFADRAYLPDGRLVPRGAPGAVLHEPEAIAQRVVRMVAGGEVEAVDGSVVPISVRSICVHGDTSDAVRIAERVRQELLDNGIAVHRFAPVGNGSPTERDSQVETTGRW
jgi:5-oxoprolinase (ATP-hydrolysing) subunit A